MEISKMFWKTLIKYYGLCKWNEVKIVLMLLWTCFPLNSLWERDLHFLSPLVATPLLSHQKNISKSYYGFVCTKVINIIKYYAIQQMLPKTEPESIPQSVLVAGTGDNASVIIQEPILQVSLCLGVKNMHFKVFLTSGQLRFDKTDQFNRNNTMVPRAVDGVGTIHRTSISVPSFIRMNEGTEMEVQKLSALLWLHWCYGWPWGARFVCLSATYINNPNGFLLQKTF